MIVTKHKSVSGGRFPAVGYNEDKIAKGVATLMAMENVSDELRCKVEALHCFGLDARAEIDRYLKDRSQTYGNSRTTRFQLHLSASIKGCAMSAEELTDFARELMKGIGYGRQPYFVYSHHDTGNNHEKTRHELPEQFAHCFHTFGTSLHIFGGVAHSEEHCLDTSGARRVVQLGIAVAISLTQTKAV